ncbi:MAG: hydantoinase B/oxoprolinase family protein [Alphaproteobacteria bacterium]|nr:hydantoinase B/oxoprolinase family protein [Alphaproteobacteria bacterium]
MHEIGALAKIQQQIMWNRLIAVVEEQAQTMIRTAFSTTVRESGDLSAGVFDLKGRMVAQAVTGTPGHVNSMAESVNYFLAKYPPETLRPGDHMITNDPWLGTGHFLDLTVVSPTFHKGKCVALFANTAHIIDIGGVGMSPEGRNVFEEGLNIPIMKCFMEGQPNETFFEFIRANSRTPVELEGDIYSLCACNDAGSKRLIEMMDEFNMSDIQALSDWIIETSKQATLVEIGKLPRGTWSNQIKSDGYNDPVTLCAKLTVNADGIDVDYAGTSPMQQRGVNVPPAYTRAYQGFGLKVVIAPEIPNNYGSLEPFRAHLPDGCILNAARPFPVTARHVIGQLLPDLMMGCLHQCIPNRVAAEGSSSLWNPPLRGGPTVHGLKKRGEPTVPEFEIITFNSGGTGARPEKDGLNAIAFPSGVRTMPVEATENVAPIIFWRKELRPDSGGAGRTRGGTGQIMEIECKHRLPFAVSAMFERVANAPKGRGGGTNGANGVVKLASGEILKTKGYQVVPQDGRLVLQLAGGGGMGDPFTRDPARVARDVRDGLVSVAKAAELYGVACDAKGVVDVAATAKLRAGRAA